MSSSINGDSPFREPTKPQRVQENLIRVKVVEIRPNSVVLEIITFEGKRLVHEFFVNGWLTYSMDVILDQDRVDSTLEARQFLEKILSKI